MFALARCDVSHYHPPMHTSQSLITELEAVASLIGKSPSTVGESIGQGGQFYARLCQGKRVWPETAERVMAKLAEIKAKHVQSVVGDCEVSHVGAADAAQEVVVQKVSGSTG